MFNLQAGIHFKEIKFFFLRVVNKFNRSGVAITYRSQQLLRRALHGGALRFRQVGGGTFLHHFLIAALTGTIALAKGDGVALSVAKNLYLNVACRRDKFFQKDSIVGKIICAESFDGVEGCCEFSFTLAQLHSDAAAARRTF